MVMKISSSELFFEGDFSNSLEFSEDCQVAVAANMKHWIEDGTSYHFCVQHTEGCTSLVDWKCRKLIWELQFDVS